MICNREFVENVIKSLNEEMFKRQLVGQCRDVNEVANVFTAGYCYYYAQLLKEIFPETKIYSSRSHVLAKIGDFFYDSYGCKEDIKLATTEQILLMPYLFNTAYSSLGAEERELYWVYCSLYHNDPAERLRRVECEDWFISNLAIAMEAVREKYSLPQYVPKDDSLFAPKGQTVDISRKHK